ncbi:MAG: hypothetical protein VX589_01370 [Myxococcota bacterium]|nr:hypothetical protein [Myxococcota bacterium]
MKDIASRLSQADFESGLLWSEYGFDHSDVHPSNASKKTTDHVLSRQRCIEAFTLADATGGIECLGIRALLADGGQSVGLIGVYGATKASILWLNVRGLCNLICQGRGVNCV